MILRPARPEDAPALAPLVYAAGSRLHDHCLRLGGREPLDYLTDALARPDGLFGHDVMTAGTTNEGRVVLSLTSYPGSEVSRLTRATLSHAVRFYGWSKLPTLLGRLLPLRTLFEPPPVDGLFLANIAVVPELRGQGLLGVALEDQISAARLLGLSKLALDVSDDTPRAEAAYLRYGFATTAHHRYLGPADIAGFKRMVLTVSPHP